MFTRSSLPHTRSGRTYGGWGQAAVAGASTRFRVGPDAADAAGTRELSDSREAAMTLEEAESTLYSDAYYLAGVSAILERERARERHSDACFL